MKSVTRFLMKLFVCLALVGASAAFAGTDEGKGNNGINNGKGNGNDPDAGSPSAPEPAALVMAATGVVLVGGYLLWRHKRVAQKVNK